MTRIERRHAVSLPALMILAIGVLAACAAQPAPQPAPRMAVLRPAPPLSSQPAHHHAAPPVPERKPTPPEAIGGPNEGAGSPDSLAMAEPPSAPAPPTLIGLDQNAARRRFGTAAERSEEPPATVWRYRNGSCELDLYFYLDLRSGRMRTLHYAFKGDADSPSGQQQCLRSLTVARGGG